MGIKLEYGKYYRDGNGNVIGPLVVNVFPPSESSYPFAARVLDPHPDYDHGDFRSWTEEGRIFDCSRNSCRREDGRDLLEEICQNDESGAHKGPLPTFDIEKFRSSLSDKEEITAKLLEYIKEAVNAACSGLVWNITPEVGQIWKSRSGLFYMLCAHPEDGSQDTFPVLLNSMNYGEVYCSKDNVNRYPTAGCEFVANSLVEAIDQRLLEEMENDL